MTTTPAAVTDAARAAEDFLRAFHDRMPGLQSKGTEAAPTRDGRTGYEVLAERVAGARRVLDLGCADGALLELLAGRGAETAASTCRRASSPSPAVGPGWPAPSCGRAVPRSCPSPTPRSTPWSATWP